MGKLEVKHGRFPILCPLKAMQRDKSNSSTQKSNKSNPEHYFVVHSSQENPALLIRACPLNLIILLITRNDYFQRENQYCVSGYQSQLSPI